MDGHLQNPGFLQVSHAQQRLGLAALAEVVKSVSDWRTVARHAIVGL